MFMRHPDSGPIVETTTEAFEMIYQEKGWEQVDDAEGELALAMRAADSARTTTADGGDLRAADAPADPMNLPYNAVTKQQLSDLAAARGLNTEGTKRVLFDRVHGVGDATPSSTTDPNTPGVVAPAQQTTAADTGDTTNGGIADLPTDGDLSA